MIAETTTPSAMAAPALPLPAPQQRPTLARAVELSRDVIYPCAAQVDGQNRFPHEAISALRQEGFLGWFVSRDHGGLGGDLVEFCRVAASVSEGCTATGLIWTMHCQQAATLARHAASTHQSQLARVAQGALLASVTSEYGKGGELLTAQAPLEYEHDTATLRRSAPVVSYGEHADIFLITMRRNATANPTDVVLVAVDRSEAAIAIDGGWDAMGMRGTRSVPMKFAARLPATNVLTADFRAMAMATMVPVGHLGWASAWYGAARGAFYRLIRTIRSSKGGARQKLTSELFIGRLAEMRLNLDILDSLIFSTAERVSRLWSERAPAEAFEDLDLTIRINNVKAGAARLSYAVADSLVSLAGLTHGYLKDSDTGIERVFRDLRSASLMFHDDRLLAASGRLCLLETTNRRTLAGSVEAP